MVAITDNRIPAACAEKLKHLSFEVITLPDSDYLAPPVCAHTDMLLFFGFGKMFCHRKYYQKNSSLIDHIAHISNRELVISDEETSDKYPCDVLFNCVLLGNYFLCNTKTVSKLILSQAQAKGYKILHTNQGYTKCSVCVLGESAIITSDRSIYDVCTRSGIDVLLTKQGDITLKGYDCGFIGGTCGTHEGTVYFCGDVSKHPSGSDIKDFCKIHGKEIFCLSTDVLLDCGSIFFV